MLAVWAGVLAATLGVVPLLYLSGLRRRGKRIEAGFWWIAAGLGVSFVADVAGVLGYHALAAQVYPVSQAALVALALLGPSAGFVAYVAVLLAAGALSIMWRGAGGYDLILRLVAWGGVSAIASVVLERSLLRAALVYGFLAMLLAWVAFTVDPGWDGWVALQLARLGTTIGFCVACARAR